MRSRMVRPPRRRRHLSPPPMRRDCPPASSTPATLSRVITACPPSGGVFAEARLALMALRILRHMRWIGVVDDAPLAGQRDEALALGAADPRQLGLPRQIDATGGRSDRRRVGQELVSPEDSWGVAVSLQKKK